MRKIIHHSMQDTSPVGGQDYYGFHRVNGGWVYREWAPGAQEVFLAGEFNGWNWTSHPLLDLGNGSWVLFLPGEDALWDGCKVTLRVDGDFRLPRDTRQLPEDTHKCGEVVDSSSGMLMEQGE